jgi:acyl-CoA thioesterase
VVDADRAARSITIHYTAPPDEGPVAIETRIERVGRSLTTVSGRMLQGDRVLALALAAFSKPRTGPSFDHGPHPEARPPESCEPFHGSSR